METQERRLHAQLDGRPKACHNMQTVQPNPKSTQFGADGNVGFHARGMLGTLLSASCDGKSTCKYELDDQWRRHLHRSGAPQKDENDTRSLSRG
uniref:Uncharacterized protein n=1 Tax=Romanomermis culicivorax TaxID=13658 RepID=A0A915IWC4_ROMCU